MCPDLILGHPAWVPEQPARPSININNNNNNNDNNDLQAFQLIVLANPKHDLYEMVLMMTDMLAARTTGATESTQNQYCPWDVSTNPHNSP